MNAGLRDKSSTTKGIFAISVIFYSFYLLGVLFPETWWTTHFIAFLPAFWKYAFLVVGAALLSLMWLPVEKWGRLQQLLSISNKYGIVGILFITLFMGGLMYKNPIVKDNYGDSFKQEKNLEKRATILPKKAQKHVFSFSLKPWAGELTVLGIMTYLTYFTEGTYQEGFYLLDLICGCLFVFCWLMFLRYYVENQWRRFVLGLAGLTAPFMLIFFGHIEIYAIVLLFNLMFLSGVLIYLRSKNKYLLWALIPMLLLCLKVHSNAVLYLPVLLLLFLYHYFSANKWVKKLLTWKGVLICIILPVVAVGLYAYFIIFKDHNDPRHIQALMMEYDRLFLPLFSPDPPYDNYNLLSFNHIFDYFSMFLLWSPIAFFILVVVAVFYRKQVNWNAPAILFTGLPLILLCGLFFVVNPLLSMQLDWDLFCLPATAFLLFTVAVLSELKSVEIHPKIIAGSLTMALMFIPVIMVHVSKDALSGRMENLGIRMYHTYYEWSNRTIDFAVDLAEHSPEEEVQRRARILKQLKPYAQPKIDREYAHLLLTQAAVYLRKIKDYEKALEYCKESEKYGPDKPHWAMYKMEANLMLGNADTAYKYAHVLLEFKHPSEKQATTILLQTAIELQKYDEAEELAARYIERWNDAPFINDVYAKLAKREDLHVLRYLFKLVPPKNKNSQSKIDELMVRADQYRVQKDFQKAVDIYLEIEQINPSYAEGKLMLMDAYFQLGQFEKAYTYALELYSIKYPNKQRALRILIHCAVEAELTKEALQHVEIYLKQWNNDKLVQQLYEGLQNETEIGELKKLFTPIN